MVNVLSGEVGNLHPANEQIFGFHVFLISNIMLSRPCLCTDQCSGLIRILFTQFYAERKRKLRRSRRLTGRDATAIDLPLVARTKSGK